jgi:hypothetical protein
VNALAVVEVVRSRRNDHARRVRLVDVDSGSCAGCGAAFSGPRFGAPRRYCSPACRNRRERPPRLTTAQCWSCSDLFAGRPGQRYCSLSCRPQGFAPGWRDQMQAAEASSGLNPSASPGRSSEAGP